jgi:hypothetical protein
MSTVLFVLSLHCDNGMALLATAMLSLLSTNTDTANKWNPSLNASKPDPHSSPKDVAIKYPQGAFIIVKRDERTVRYLHFNPSERHIYNIWSSATYRGLPLISTDEWYHLSGERNNPQPSFAASYMVINICYCIGATLPPADHWNLT